MSKKSNKKGGINRRDFIKISAVGLSASTFGFAPIHKEISQSSNYKNIKWDMEVDIIVCGAGGASLTAAYKSALLRNNTIILEKAPYFGGSTMKSGGILWVPNNPILQRDGTKDNKEDAMAYMVRLAYPELFKSGSPRFGVPEYEYTLIEAYYDNGSKALSDLMSHYAYDPMYMMGFDGKIFPDYFDHIKENKLPRGRTLAPIALDAQVRAMTGGSGMGTDLIRRLKMAVDSLKIPIYYKHQVDKVIENENAEIIGVRAKTGNTYKYFKARKAVIFGVGGFTHNKAMARQYLRGPIFGGCTVPTSEGDFVKIGLEIGADLGNMANAWWADMVLEHIFEGTTAVFTSAFAIPGDSMIIVNKYGNRVVNEKRGYNERTQVHFDWDPVKGEFSNLLYFMVYDDRTAKSVASGGGSFAELLNYPLPSNINEAPHVVSGNTFEELNNNLNVKLNDLTKKGIIPDYALDEKFIENLRLNVDKFNKFANAGIDEDFHRGDAGIDNAFHMVPPQGNEKPNRTMYPISNQGPYYAIVLAPGTLGTKGGPKINTKAQILDVNGNVIKGLYGAGNCIASPAAKAYWGAGGTIGPAMVFGWIAAVNAHNENIK